MDRLVSKIGNQKNRFKARLKGSSRNNESPSNVTTPAPIGSSGARPDTTSASPSPHKLGTKEGMVIGLNALADALSNVGGAFEPLRSAVKAIYECIELYDMEVTNKKEYEAIIADLEARFQDLAGYFNSPTPPAMTSSIQNLAVGMIRETNNMKQKVDRSTLERYTHATQDASDILGYYRRICTLIERLMQNANMNIWKIVDEEATERRLKELGQSSAAWYSSVESTGRRDKCTNKTRTQLLLDMNSWAYDGQEKVYWLNGMAGTGKTTIAYSLSDELHINRKLAASFFCSRQLPSCRDVNLILPTIAYQLARFSRPFRYALSGILEQHPDIHTRRLLEQFKGLIVEPLREVQKTMPANLVVVIDGLDECEKHGDVQMLLDIILSQIPNLPIKIFISSRPEPDVISGMRSRSGKEATFQLRLHELEHTVVRQDIKTYLEDQLSYMELAPNDLQTLTSQCGLLFIYAATAVRYIKADNPARSPDRLREVLEVPISINDQEETIDNLYATIIEAAFNNKKLKDRDRREMTLVVHLVVCAQEPLTPTTIAGLLNIRSEPLVHAALAPLLSVLSISETSGVVNTLHMSFLDYLFNKDRSGKFYCDSLEHNRILARSCFSLIKAPEPPFNICGLESSFILDKDVPGLNERVDNKISSELFYACRYWGSHLELAQTSEDLFDLLEELFAVRFLLWMEIMNLKKCIHEGAKAISQVHVWCQSIRSTKKLQDITLDASKFTTAFSLSPAVQSTPHIYVSALAIWPKRRPISEIYSKTVKSLAKLAGTATKQRGLALRAILTDTNAVESTAYSPDGAYIASGSDDETIRIWDTHTGRAVGSPLEGHTGWVNSVSYSPDGAYIVSGSRDATLRIWDARTCQLVGGPFKGHIKGVNSVSYSPDGVHIVSGSADTTILIWDAHTGHIFGNPLDTHTRGVNSVSYSPNGAYIVSGSDDNTIRIWDAHTGQMVGNPLQGHTGRVSSVSYSFDSIHIVSSSSDGSIRIWDARTCQIVGSPLKGHTKRVNSVSYSPDGAYIVSGSDDGTIQIWNSNTGQLVGSPIEGHTRGVNSVSYSPDGEYIVSASDDRTIRIWDAHADHTVDNLLEGHNKRVNSVAYSPDSAYIVSGSDDRTIRIWEAKTGQMIGSPLEGHILGTNLVSYLPDGAHIISGYDDGTIQIWNARTGQTVGGSLKDDTDWTNSVLCSPDSAYIISGSENRTLQIWDAETGQTIGSPLKGNAMGTELVSYSPDGTHIVSGSDEDFNSMVIWDTRTGQMVGDPLEGHTGGVKSVSYSPNGAYIVSGSEDRTIRIWDAKTGQMIGSPLEGHTQEVNCVSYSPDGAYIVSGSSDTTIRIWDVQECQRSEKSLGNARIPHSSPNSEQPKIDTHGLQASSEDVRWVLNEQGWIVSDHSELLMWIPIDLRPLLWRPRNTAVISKQGWLRLDFSDSTLGPMWYRCYQPENMASKIY